MSKKIWVRIPFRKEVIELFRIYQGALQKRDKKYITNNEAMICLMKSDPEFYKENKEDISELLNDEVRGGCRQ